MREITKTTTVKLREWDELNHQEQLHAIRKVTQIIPFDDFEQHMLNFCRKELFLEWDYENEPFYFDFIYEPIINDQIAVLEVAPHGEISPKSCVNWYEKDAIKEAYGRFNDFGSYDETIGYINIAKNMIARENINSIPVNVEDAREYLFECAKNEEEEKTIEPIFLRLIKRITRECGIWHNPICKEIELYLNGGRLSLKEARDIVISNEYDFDEQLNVYDKWGNNLTFFKWYTTYTTTPSGFSNLYEKINCVLMEDF